MRLPCASAWCGYLRLQAAVVLPSPAGEMPQYSTRSVWDCSRASQSGDYAQLAERLKAIVQLPNGDQARLRAAARQTAVEFWSWKSVAQWILAAGVRVP
jgi:hypothetical protein